MTTTQSGRGFTRNNMEKKETTYEKIKAVVEAGYIQPAIYHYGYKNGYKKVLHFRDVLPNGKLIVYNTEKDPIQDCTEDCDYNVFCWGETEINRFELDLLQPIARQKHNLCAPSSNQD